MEVSSIILAVIAVIVGMYYFFTRGYDFFEKINLPYKKPVPLLGSFWESFFRIRSIAEIVETLYKVDKDAKYVGCFDIMTPVYVLRDPELIKSVTVKNFDHFPNHRTLADEVNEPLFGKNLFSLSGDRWKDSRTVLSPSFTSSKMKGMFNLMSECAENFSNYLSNLPANEREMNVKDAIARFTSDVIATCAFGIHVDSLRDRNNKFYVYGREASTFGSLATIRFFLIRSLPKLSSMLGLRLVRKDVADFFTNLIATTIKTRDEQNISRPDMLQLMMETRNKQDPSKLLTVEDMTAHAFIFFIAGFENTSTLMCFAAHELAVNPDIQERLQEEIDKVLEENNGQVTYDAINSMQLLEAIVDETLRMYPLAVFADRVCVKSFELPPAKPGLQPVIVKPGDNIWAPIYAIQHDEEYFEEPQKFKPDRFVTDGKKIHNSGTYLPFGMGPRICIANRFALLETKVLLFHMFARFTVKPCSKTVIPMELNRRGFTMTSHNGFWMSIHPRNKPQFVLNTSTSNGVAVS